MVLQRQLSFLQRELQDHTEILELLRSAPESEALQVLRSLRSTSHAAFTLASIKGSAHAAARPSDALMARATLPPTESSIEFELNVRHHSVYPTFEPLDILSTDINAFFVKPAHRLPGILPPHPLVPSIPDSVDETYAVPAITAVPPSPLRGIPPKRSSHAAGPLPQHALCDSRLDHLSIGYWTKVPIGDEFAACVLSHYLELYHPIFACFDVNLFLSDLVDHKLNYCSPFLVSSLMSLACVSMSCSHEPS
jgi:hypothetical protein